MKTNTDTHTHIIHTLTSPSQLPSTMNIGFIWPIVIQLLFARLFFVCVCVYACAYVELQILLFPSETTGDSDAHLICTFKLQ